MRIYKRHRGRKLQRAIVIGADHAGFALKEQIKEWLLKKRYTLYDVGPRFYQKDDDYPFFAEKLGKAVVQKKIMGVLICGSAEGVCIAANKVKGVRAVVAFNKKTAKMSKEDNDANVLCLSGWWLKEKHAQDIVDVWLRTKFSGIARHKRRILQIKKMEKN